jgi:FixJ family two-component response regulator
MVDDDKAFRASTRALLEDDGYEVLAVPDGQSGVEALKRGGIDLMLLDLRMPGPDGLRVLEALRAAGEDVPILMISGYGTVNSAVEAMRLGADDFITKPVEHDALLARIEELLARRPRLETEEERGVGPGGLLGASEPMRQVFSAIRRVAPTGATVLIVGETGTGKELVARAIHELSDRKALPFLPLDCGAQAEGLLASELFGHVRGSFTGAVRDRPGVFQAADHSRRRRPAGASRHPADRCHEHRSRGGRSGGHLPARSLLPAEGLSDRAAAPTPAERRHPAAGRAGAASGQRRAGSRDPRSERHRDAPAHGVRLAGQRPRVGCRRGERRDPL